MKVEYKTLPNKLKCIYADVSPFPTATILLIVKTGSRSEINSQSGIAHFIEHILFKGSKKFPNSFSITSAIDSIGGEINAYTTKNHTGFWVKTPIEHVDFVLSLLSDLVQHPLLENHNLEKEKQVIIEEINSYEDSPARKIGDILSDIIFPNHPLGRDIAGSKETVKSFQKKDILTFMKSNYTPDNALLVIAGGLENNGITKKTISTSVKKYFLPWNSTYSGSILTWKKRKTTQLKVVNKKTEQVHFAFGLPTFSFYDSRRYPLVLLSSLLGSGMSSRLFMKLREEMGLCYYIYSHPYFYSDAGYFASYAGVTNTIDQVKFAMSAMWNEHLRIAHGEISESDVSRVKQMVRGSLLLGLEDSQQIASVYGIKYLFENKRFDPTEILKEIDAVTLSEIVESAKDLFNSQNLHIAVIGPFKENQFDIPNLIHNNKDTRHT